MLAEALLEAAWVSARIAAGLSLVVAILGGGGAATFGHAGGPRRGPASGRRILAMMAALGVGVTLAFATRGEAVRWFPGLLQGAIAALAACGALAAASLIVWSARAIGRIVPLPAVGHEGAALVTTGPYAVVRHPLYASIGLLVGSAGLALGSLTGTALAVGLYAASAIWRARFEDRVLSVNFGGAFEEYRARVPAFLPRI